MNKLFKLVALLCVTISAFAQIEVPNSIKNDTVTGTTTNKLVKLNTTGGVPSVIVTATTDTTGAIGVCESGCGTTGVAGVITLGKADCIFDNTTVTNDYVQISPTVAGDCHDAGATRPTSGQIIGTVFAAGGTAGTYTIYLNKDIYPASTSAPSCAVVGSSDTISAAGAFATTCSLGAPAGVGSWVIIDAQGIYTTTGTASPIATFQVNAFGTTGICPQISQMNLSIGQTNGPWSLRCVIQIVTTGAPGTAFAWGSAATTGSAGGNALFKLMGNGATASATTNSAQTVSIQETGTLVAGQTFTLQSFTASVRNP